MLNLLLKKNEYIQVSLLKQLLKNQGISKNTLRDMYQLNTVTFSRYIRTINQDLTDCFPDEGVSLLVTPSNELTISYPPSIKGHTILNTIIHSYLSASSTYHILTLLIKEKISSVDQFLIDINVSQSYFNKLLKQINLFLAPSSIKVTQRNKNIFFDGPLTHIIYLEFLMLNTLTTFSPHQSENNYSAPNGSQTNTIGDDSLDCLVLTLEKYQSELQTLVITDPAVRSLLIELHQFQRDNYPALKKCLATASYDAILFVNLLIRNSDNLANNSTNEKEAIGQVLLTLDHPISQDTGILLNNLKQKFLPTLQLSDSQRQRAMYFFTSTLLYLCLFKFNFKTLFKFKDGPLNQHGREQETLYQDIQQYFNTPSNLSDLSLDIQEVIKTNAQVCIDTTYTTIRATYDPKLRIYLNFNYQLTLEFFVKRRLFSIFNPETLSFVDSPENVDLIITDYISERPEGTAVFLFNDTNSIAELTELLILLANLMTAKISHFTGASLINKKDEN